MTHKLTAIQSDALTLAHMAKTPQSAVVGYRSVTWTSLEAKGLVTLQRGPNKRDVLGASLTDAGRAIVQGTDGPADEWPKGIVADGSVIVAEKMSDSQVAALEDVATVGFTPAARQTVESLIRSGLIVWETDSRDPEMFRLTDEGRRAYAAVTTWSVVPNRASRRAARRAARVEGRRAMRRHGRRIARFGADVARKSGERVQSRRPGGLAVDDKVRAFGQVFTLTHRPILHGEAWELMVNDADGTWMPLYVRRGDRVRVLRGV